jgi:hypothetical protein
VAECRLHRVQDGQKGPWQTDMLIEHASNRVVDAGG